jgi:hypothetical protein
MCAAPEQRAAVLESVMFRCPITSQHVQILIAEEIQCGTAEDYFGVACTACQRPHFVNPRTGRVLGTDANRND